MHRHKKIWSRAQSGTIAVKKEAIQEKNIAHTDNANGTSDLKKDNRRANELM